MTNIKDDIRDDPGEEFRFILVGNIIDKHYYGENKEIRSGTKHFRAGAKVYLFPEYGGTEHASMPVYGLPRKSWKKIKVAIRLVMIKNVRVKKTFDLKLIEMITDTHIYAYLGNNEDRLNEFADSLNKNNKEIIE